MNTVGSTTIPAQQSVVDDYGNEVRSVETWLRLRCLSNEVFQALPLSPRITVSGR